MKSGTIISAVFVFLFLFVFGCDKVSLAGTKKPAAKASAPAETISYKGTLIAKVGNIPVTLEDLNQEIDAYNSMVPAEKPELKIATREQKLDYLKNQKVRQVLLYQEAMNRGLDRQEEVLRALEKTKQDLLVMELVRNETEKVDVSSKEIEDYYNTYKDQLKEPEEREIREIVLLSEQAAKEVLIELLQGQDFATLAKEKSKAPSAKDGGDLGVIQPGKKFPLFDQTAFSDNLEAGKTSNIFKGPDGYYIIKLEAKRGGKQKTLSELWDDIKKGLTFLKQQKKLEDLIARLSRDTKIEVYESEIR